MSMGGVAVDSVAEAARLPSRRLAPARALDVRKVRREVFMGDGG
jgi:hypothetical protein